MSVYDEMVSLQNTDDVTLRNSPTMSDCVKHATFIESIRRSYPSKYYSGTAHNIPTYHHDPPTVEESKHTRTSYHTTRPQLNMDGHFHSMNGPPPKLWGVSNSNWKREQRMNPNKGSYKSYASMDDSERRYKSRRTGGAPNVDSIGAREPQDDPSNYSHSTRSFIPRSRQVARSRSLLNDKIQWDGQYSSFRTYKLAIMGHLLQVGAGYMVNPTFHESYLQYADAEADYLESEDFKLTYPEIPLLQAKLDRAYLYGMLISSNRKDGERKFILKYERIQDRLMAWIEFLKDYDNLGSSEVRSAKLESKIHIKYTYEYPGGLLNYLDTLQANLNELNNLLPGLYLDGQK